MHIYLSITNKYAFIFKFTREQINKIKFLSNSNVCINILIIGFYAVRMNYTTTKPNQTTILRTYFQPEIKSNLRVLFQLIQYVCFNLKFIFFKSAKQNH